MKEIPISRGLVAIVDDCDFEDLSKLRWTALKGNSTWYALHHFGPGQKPASLLMHRAILKAPAGIEVDHVDSNGLHNWRSNLRQATHAQNMANRQRNAKSTSGYKGVLWVSKSQKWAARIRVNGRDFRLGYFFDPQDAARAYDLAASKAFGEFARLNFPANSEHTP